MALSGLPAGVEGVVVADGPTPVPELDVVVVFELDGFEGDELQAESPSAPARTMAHTSAPERRES